MPDLTIPLRDVRFALYDVLDFDGHLAALSVEDFGRDLLDAILDEAARFAEQELAPLNEVGDRQGCRLENGVVRTPDGFAEAYRGYAAAGWTAVTGDPEHGGQGLPDSVGLLVEEMMTTANMAWTMYPALSHGAINALTAHGSAEQKAIYLSRLLSGEWTGTMCLTESHAGSDVGLLRTRAEPRPDGSYLITGSKIFISAGDHDMAENIVHLVLARTPDAPAGTRGISLFIVPKFLPDEQGRPGERNAVICSALEEKMGIHGNATCVLNFDGATGYLVGPENQGMRCMFTMMNAARIVVGVQAIGLMERGYQAATAYALEREQMRSLRGAQNDAGSADPIIVHPDVRRMLLTQKALVEGNRLLAYLAGLYADCSHMGESESARAEALTRLDFLTPIVKGFATEVGFESVNHALQIFGGHGFIRETGVEQLVRDARITLIYEGTTQIQALDLMGRKTLADQGRTLIAFGEEIARSCADARAVGDERLTAMAGMLETAVSDWGGLAFAVGSAAQADPDEIGAASVDFLMCSGYVLVGWMWLRSALAARDGAAGDAFLRGKLDTARFYFDRLLPRTAGHAASIRSGAANLMTVEPESLAHG